MIEVGKREQCLCFTGHRPHKLRGYTEVQIKNILRTEIIQAYQSGFRTFISGMAMGVDIWAAELVSELKEQNDDVHLICAVPYPCFEASWNLEWQMRYRALLKQADLVQVISPFYHHGVYQIRNEWMVDHSSLVIAIYNGDPKCGTKNTIDYAEKHGIPVIIPREWDSCAKIQN